MEILLTADGSVDVPAARMDNYAHGRSLPRFRSEPDSEVTPRIGYSESTKPKSAPKLCQGKGIINEIASGSRPTKTAKRVTRGQLCAQLPSSGP